MQQQPIPVVASPSTATVSPGNFLFGLLRRWQTLLDSTTPHKTYRWTGSGLLAVAYILRVALLQGWYIVTVRVLPCGLFATLSYCCKVHAGDLPFESLFGFSVAKV